MYSIELKGPFPDYENFHICDVHPTIPCAKPETTALAKEVKDKSRDDWAFREIQGTEIAPFTPTFYWFHEIDGKKYVAFENLTKDMQSPCVAVLKLGNRPYDLYATPEKVQKVTSKCQGSITSTLSFRLNYLQTKKNQQVVETVDTKTALGLSNDDVAAKLKQFIGEQTNEFSEQLKQMVSGFQEMVNRFPAFRAYNVSLFIAYDGDAPTSLVMKLIHLNHTYIDIGKELLQNFYDPKYEDGCIAGLKSIASVIGVELKNEEEDQDNEDYDDDYQITINIY